MDEGTSIIQTSIGHVITQFGMGDGQRGSVASENVLQLRPFVQGMEFQRWFGNDGIGTRCILARLLLSSTTSTSIRRGIGRVASSTTTASTTTRVHIIGHDMTGINVKLLCILKDLGHPHHVFGAVFVGMQFGF